MQVFCANYANLYGFYADLCGSYADLCWKRQTTLGIGDNSTSHIPAHESIAVAAPFQA